MADWPRWLFSPEGVLFFIRDLNALTKLSAQRPEINKRVGNMLQLLDMQDGSSSRQQYKYGWQEFDHVPRRRCHHPHRFNRSHLQKRTQIGMGRMFKMKYAICATCSRQPSFGPERAKAQAVQLQYSPHSTRGAYMPYGLPAR
jgi:hypothetical protein